ncbi:MULTISPECIES: CocE/NonD family hydrolase [Prochlorococcus]|uniref:Alpha/beta superfamily hydrolase n=1 Tax=Prochlorococcus marinus (strain SARG / CCMP1375 / SS120) TaxID=167539 RepID=Q7VBL5_PROMA|nr:MULTISPECIES: CocE/NonD family hydrolase [Prochlorococcus]AAQ00122.1 Alpha/beta superfamily hydrolase [Prochlorococcus marinus subsp. marinus str. CCMP1375]KGG13918.1 alpha/beta hydrolase [Prochlorococcus marinus str. LG]KGG19051.1 alpha/beta hydrolase [Prochlorococcus marinus str. SS2]KGG23409.1 alpha/beta hydrolase [Prochlorococcus marinus str. SS35]KGG32355.1 alpha/beta hydrolase [Prochlorococcus marinus str. SS51]
MNQAISYKDQSLSLIDGIKLRSRLWMPKDDGPWPALLMRQPYGRKIASTVTYAHPSWWASHGYLVIVQDVRGQGASEGEFIGFDQESSDTTQTHQWVRSLPECNGLLGTYGFSYQGLTQLLGEEGSQPPDCLAPAMTGTYEDEHWSCEGGAYWWHIGLSWGLQLAAQKQKRLKELKGWEEIRKSLQTGSYLCNGPELLKKYDPNGMAYKWLAQSESKTNQWKIHKPLTTWTKQPMLLIAGWWDPHLKGILDIYQKSISNGGQPEIHIGPASHLEWWKGTNQIQLDFFNFHLKDKKSKVKKTPSKKLWNLTIHSWETPGKTKSSIKQNTWFLSSEGLACGDTDEGLLRSHPPGKGYIDLVHDPWRPVPAIGGHLSPTPGEANRKKIDERGDVATFTSTPFKEDAILEGIPKLCIHATSDQKGFDLFIALSIILKNQSNVQQLSTGVLRIRDNDPHIFLKREVTLQPFLATFHKGSQLRISVSGASWPAIAVNPGTDKYPCVGPSPNCLITTIAMDLNQSRLQIQPLFTNIDSQEYL